MHKYKTLQRIAASQMRIIFNKLQIGHAPYAAFRRKALGIIARIAPVVHDTNKAKVLINNKFKF